MKIVLTDIGKNSELLARRWIEDQGFVAHDANVMFGANCPNIDLVVYGKHKAIYVQIKASSKPATANSILIDGAPWTESQLHNEGKIYNKHEHFQANLIVLVDTSRPGEAEFYVARPQELEKLARERGLAHAAKPKRDGSKRSLGFRKELPRELISKWQNAWHLFGEPLHSKNP